MRVTLKEVAVKADLSVSTACRALNGHPAISQKTAERVKKIAGELRYNRVRDHRRITAVNAALAGCNIAIASLAHDQSLVSMPVIANAFRGAEEALLAAGANSQRINMPDLSQAPRDLNLDCIHGFILVGAMVNEFAAAAETEVVNRLRKFPSVWVIGQPPGAWGDAVVSDDFALGAGAAEQLFAKGHRRLAFLNPMPENLLFLRREDGFCAAARRLGAEVHFFCQSPARGWRLPLQPPTSNFAAVESLVDRMLATEPCPTGVFAAADSIAALAYCAFGMRGIRVGKDISLIAGNNTPELLAVPYPHLATFDIHARKIGALAVRQLALHIAEMSSGTHIAHHLVVQPTFVPGESICNLNTR